MSSHLLQLTHQFVHIRSQQQRLGGREFPTAAEFTPPATEELGRCFATTVLQNVMREGPNSWDVWFHFHGMIAI